jgi:chromosome segregation ATPase
MKLKILAFGVGLAAAITPVALADNSLGAVNADIAKLQADFQSSHDVLMADAQKLQGDVALIKPGNKDAAKAAIQADWQQLKSDFAAKKTTMQADWQQLHTDLQAARQAKAGTKADREALKQTLQQVRDTFKAGREQVHQAVEAAHAALKAARAAGVKISPSDANSVSDKSAVPATNP